MGSRPDNPRTWNSGLSAVLRKMLFMRQGPEQLFFPKQHNAPLRPPYQRETPKNASNTQEAVVYRAGQEEQFGSVVPVWKGIIHDPYTAATKRQVSLTAMLYFNFTIVQSTGYKLESYLLA